MRKLLLAIGMLFAIVVNSNAQYPKEFFVIPTGDSLAIYLTFSPRANIVYNVFRKTDTGYVKVNSKPVSPELDIEKAKIMLSNDWDFLSKVLKTDDDYGIVRATRRNDFNATLLTLISPRVAKVAGRLLFDSGIKLGESYHYKIIFSTVSGIKKDSLEKTVSTKLIIPNAPTGLVAKNVNNVIELTWNYPKWNGDYSDLGFRYNVYRDNGDGKFEIVNDRIIYRDDFNKPIFRDAWLTFGKKYSYYVTIVDPQGHESKASNRISIVLKDVVPPKIVKGVASNSVQKGIALSWNMSPDLDVMGYNLFRSNVVYGDSVKLNKNMIPVETPYFLDTSVVIDKQYFYYVIAYDSSNNQSIRSNPHSQIWEDSTPPLPPTKLVAKPQNGFVKLSWNKTKSKDIVGYLVFRGMDSTLTPRITEYPVTATTFIDSGFNSTGYNYGATLNYFVAAIDSSRNESERVYIKVDVPDIQAPAIPSNFRVENKNGIYLNIKSNRSISKDVAKYSIYKRELNGKEILLGEFSKAPISIRDSNVTKGKKYFYSISLIDSAGNKTEKSKEVEVFVRDFNPPPAPRNIRATLVNGKVKLTWGKVIDFDFAGYNVYRSNSPSGTYKLLNKKLISATEFVDNSGNKKMFYRIKAVDTSGNESKYEKSVAVK